MLSLSKHEGDVIFFERISRRPPLIRPHAEDIHQHQAGHEANRQQPDETDDERTDRVSAGLSWASDGLAFRVHGYLRIHAWLYGCFGWR